MKIFYKEKNLKLALLDLGMAIFSFWRAKKAFDRVPIIEDKAAAQAAKAGKKGGNYVDITVEKNGTKYRINTVDTYKDGTPTAREANAANSINSKIPGEPEIILIPKDASDAEITAILTEKGLLP